MYINMTPDKTNKTLHASQDDTKRQFKFKLFNDSQVLDTSGAATPIKFDVEPDGIEQLLPVNSSSPSTTPIIADIQYPDVLREDQEFFERITPSTIAGKATINKIIGNTLVYNQLLDDPQGTSTSYWRSNNNAYTSVSVQSGGILITALQDTNGVGAFEISRKRTPNHKYFCKADVYPSNNMSVNLTAFAVGYGTTHTLEAQKWKTIYNEIVELAGSSASGYFGLFCYMSQGQTLLFKNCMLIDLTLMFGAGNEPSADEFYNMWCNVNYYDTNIHGSLLSFNGTGLKTIGKNIFNPNITDVPLSNCTGTQVDGVISLTASGTDMYANRQATTGSNWTSSTGKLISVSPNSQYTLKLSNSSFNKQFISFFNRNLVATRNYVSTASSTYTFTTGDNEYYIVVRFGVGSAEIGTTYSTTIQLEKGNTATTYEPYIENTIDLPTSTYFPNGMKSAGSVYDEFTYNKVTTRVGVLNLGSISWSYTTNSSNIPIFVPSGNINARAPGSNNLLCPLYTTIDASSRDGINGDKQLVRYNASSATKIAISNFDYTDATAFRTAMNGVYLYYELRTPIEENIESYSLVSEDIEKPLEYDDGFLVCDSDGLTSKSGFIPCKVKMVKEDEILYSQLINLHVERRP